MYELILAKQAQKYLLTLDKPLQARIIKELTILAENPYNDVNVKRLKGYSNTYL